MTIKPLHLYILGAVIIAATVAVIIALSINTRTVSEQNFQQCMDEAVGVSLDKQIETRNRCGSYLE